MTFINYIALLTRKGFMTKEIKKYQDEILIFVSTFVLGFLAHGFIYLNGIFSHDASRIFQNDVAFQISLGRFLQPIYLWFRGYIAAPFLIGIIALFFLSLAICFIQKTFNLKKRISIVLLCAFLIMNSTIALGNASYMPWSDIYMLCFFLASFGVYAFVKIKYGFVITIICISVISSLYQPYFATAVVLLMLYELKRLLEKVDAKEVFIDGLKAILTLIIGLLLYYGILNLILNITGIELSSGSNSIGGVGDFSGMSVISLIIDTYKYCVKSFIRPITYHHNAVGLANVLMVSLTLFGIGLLAKYNKIKNLELVLMLLVIALLPFGMNIIYFISKGSVHELVIFSFYLFYLLVIVVYDKDGFNQLFKKVILFLMCYILMNNLIYSNQLYLKKDLEYKATLSVMTRIIDRIEQVEGYELNQTPVSFVGNLAGSPLSTNRYGYGEIVGIGIDGFGSYSTTYDLTYYWYMTEILGYPMIVVPSYDYSGHEEVKEMGIFPSVDSIKMIDGTIVVKLS